MNNNRKADNTPRSYNPAYNNHGKKAADGNQGHRQKGRDDKGGDENKYQCSGNLGLIYTRRYFEGLTESLINDDENGQSAYYKQRNDNLIRQAKSYGELKDKNNGMISVLGDNTISYFELKTTYPGLLVGSGILHATGHKGETKLGLTFDHTTGLPYLPGSSVKGLLRSVFPLRSKGKKQECAHYIWEKLLKIKEKDESSLRLNEKEILDLISRLEILIFGATNKEKNNKSKGGDIFFDAFPTKAGDKGLLGLDYITPHKNEFSNPTPIQFLRIEPDVTFRFEFLLNDSEIEFVADNKKVTLTVNKDEKKLLFEAILKDVGIGAKTNVGYGQLV